MKFSSTFFFIVLLILLIGCQSTKSLKALDNYNISYLDEYVFYEDTVSQYPKIGGLSDLYYDARNQEYYLVCDDANQPRFYKASIRIDQNQIDTIIFKKEVFLEQKEKLNSTDTVLDLEAISLFSSNQLIFASEGSINHKFNPSVFYSDTTGKIRSQVVIPSYFKTDNQINTPRHNAVFEALCSDHEEKGFWVATELALEKDGAEPSVSSGGGPVRISHYQEESKKFDFQFLYSLDPLSKDPKGKFSVNGITAMLQLDQHQFLVVEREYVSGYGTDGNNVRIYLVTKQNTTNTLNEPNLAISEEKIADKKLVFDFETVRSKLTREIVDNIEGISFGPELSEGAKSIILVSDNNFNPVEQQINQFILLALTKEKIKP